MGIHRKHNVDENHFSYPDEECILYNSLFCLHTDHIHRLEYLLPTFNTLSFPLISAHCSDLILPENLMAAKSAASKALNTCRLKWQNNASTITGIILQSRKVLHPNLSSVAKLLVAFWRPPALNSVFYQACHPTWPKLPNGVTGKHSVGRTRVPFINWLFHVERNFIISSYNW